MADLPRRISFTEGALWAFPDGRWLAYVSNESGRFEIYVQPYPGAIAKAARLITSPACRLRRELRPAVPGRGGVIQDLQLRRMVQEFLSLRG